MPSDEPCHGNGCKKEASLTGVKRKEKEENMKQLFFVLVAMGLLFTGYCKAEVQAPTFQPAGGEEVFDTEVEVTIATSTAGATIYYTTDGSQPTVQSEKYISPILINHTGSKFHDPHPEDTGEDCNNPRPVQDFKKTIRAIAVAEDGTVSAGSSTYYKVDKIYSKFHIPYKKIPNSLQPEAHKLDIYYPKKLEAGKIAPVVIFVPGGGWKQADKNLYFEVGNTLAGCYGYITVVVNYQVSEMAAMGDDHVYFPTHINDIAQAFRTVKSDLPKWLSNVDYSYAPRFILFGQSAGAHLVSLLALHPYSFEESGNTVPLIDINDVGGVISMSAVYDLAGIVTPLDNPYGLTVKESELFMAVLKNAFNSTDPEKLKAYSPSTFAGEISVPFYVLTTVQDGIGFEAQARIFYNLLVKKIAENKKNIEVQFDMYKCGDFEPDIWEAAVKMAKCNLITFNLLPPGHYGEVAVINTRDWNKRPVKILADFIDSLKLWSASGGAPMSKGPATREGVKRPL